MSLLLGKGISDLQSHFLTALFTSYGDFIDEDHIFLALRSILSSFEVSAPASVPNSEPESTVPLRSSSRTLKNTKGKKPSDPSPSSTSSLGVESLTTKLTQIISRMREYYQEALRDHIDDPKSPIAHQVANLRRCLVYLILDRHLHEFPLESTSPESFIAILK